MAHLGERKDDGYFESSIHSTQSQQISGVNSWDDRWTAEQKLDGTYNQFQSTAPLSGTRWDEDWWDGVKSLASEVKADLGIIFGGDSAIPKRIWTLAKFPVVHLLHTAILIVCFPFALLSFVIRLLVYALLISLAFMFMSTLGTWFGLWNWDYSNVMDWVKKEATMLVTEASETSHSLGRTTPKK